MPKQADRNDNITFKRKPLLRLKILLLEPGAAAEGDTARHRAEKVSICNILYGLCSLQPMAHLRSSTQTRVVSSLARLGLMPVLSTLG